MAGDSPIKVGSEHYTTSRHSES